MESTCTHINNRKSGVNKNTNWWTSIGYIPFEYLRKSWQKVVLDIMKDYKKRCRYEKISK